MHWYARVLVAQSQWSYDESSTLCGVTEDALESLTRSIIASTAVQSLIAFASGTKLSRPCAIPMAYISPRFFPPVTTVLVYLFDI